jgi:hypothetical protein
VHPSWLSWVTAVRGCLNALDADCDNVDVAGHSGYAFYMCITDDVSAEGPATRAPWSGFARGARSLGRATLEDQMGAWGEAPDWVGAEETVLALARREVDAGRPCVMWGTGIPEFGVIVGYEGDEVIYRRAGNADESRVKCGHLSNPGGSYGPAFPYTTTVRQTEADRSAIANAVRLLRRLPDRPDHKLGLEAYANWITALRERGPVAFGNSYCAQIYSQAKQYAHDFLTRFSKRNDHAAGPLDDAVIAYQDCAKGMQAVAELFAFPGGGDPIADPIAIADACEALAAARDAESRACQALEAARDIPWPDPE